MTKLNNLPTLPSLPSISKQRPLRACQCGCGGTTQRGFVPGHDARLKAGVIRVVRGAMTLDEVEQAMGAGYRKAVEATLKNPLRLKTWSIVIETPKVEKAG